MADEPETYELEELAEQPGLYFNPRTEVIIAVDDSASVDQEAFDRVEQGGEEWVRISDEIPIDEQARDEAMEAYQADYHAGGSGSLSATVRDQEADHGERDEPPPAPELDDDPDPDSEADEVDETDREPE